MCIRCVCQSLVRRAGNARLDHGPLIRVTVGGVRIKGLLMPRGAHGQRLLPIDYRRALLGVTCAV